MRDLFAFIASVVIASGLSGAANSQGWLNSLKGLPITEITGQIGNGTAYVVNQINLHSQQIRKDSVGRLVIDLANLAGSENALANEIDVLAANPQDAHHSPGAGGNGIMDALNKNLDLVRSGFIQVNEDLANLDQQWAQANALLQIDIGSFAHDGALFYCINDCGTNFYTGQPAVRLTDPQQTGELAAVLRSDFAKIRQIAQDVQSANAQSEAKR